MAILFVPQYTDKVSSVGDALLKRQQNLAVGMIIKWKHFPRQWPLVREIHRSPVNSPHKGQRCRSLMFSLICARTNSWSHNEDAGVLRHHYAHYDVIVMGMLTECEYFMTHRIFQNNKHVFRVCPIPRYRYVTSRWNSPSRKIRPCLSQIIKKIWY